MQCFGGPKPYGDFEKAGQNFTFLVPVRWAAFRARFWFVFLSGLSLQPACAQSRRRPVLTEISLTCFWCQNISILNFICSHSRCKIASSLTQTKDHPIITGCWFPGKFCGDCFNMLAQAGLVIRCTIKDSGLCYDAGPAPCVTVMEKATQENSSTTVLVLSKVFVDVFLVN